MKMYSDKQLRLMRDWKHGKLKRLNLLEGSVRSGKTWISLVLWAFWVASMPKSGAYLMASKSLTTLRRNVLDLLQELVGENNFTYSLSKKEGRLFGRLVYLEGVNDARAESKIRGLTLHGAYCDELTLFTEDFFSMLLSRLSEPGAKLIATTNPDSPNHWLKQNYLDRREELELYTLQFLIDDNFYLPKDYVDSLKKEYVGVFYDRFILGLWVVAEGLVYPNFDPAKHVTDVPQEYDARFLYYVSIDYGTSNPFSMGLWRVQPDTGEAERVKEYYYESRRTNVQKTDNQYYSEIVKFTAGYLIQALVIDPSAASMIAVIRERGVFNVLKANNDVLNGIRYTAAAINKGLIKIDRSCEASIREYRTYAWDEKAQDDKVIKENDHAMDDTRYFVSTVLMRQWRYEIIGDADAE